ncbi:MAG: ribonuclease III [Chloroflexota bacterium]
MNPDPQTRGEIESPEALARRLSLPFGDLYLLARALTHRSYRNENSDVIQDNERLEFLGDAVLDFVVGAWLYNRFPEMAEGEMTRMRSALVRTEQLAEFARQLDLGAAMRLGRGEQQAGGRRRKGLLCATFEAVVGGLYLDKGIPTVIEFVTPFLEEAADMILLQPDIFDPKSRLQEWAQAQHLGIPHYIILESSGPDHDKRFAVEAHVGNDYHGRGNGPSKQVAEQAAAQALLESVGLL